MIDVTFKKGLARASVDVEDGSTIAQGLKHPSVAAIIEFSDNDVITDLNRERNVASDASIRDGAVYVITARSNDKA